MYGDEFFHECVDEYVHELSVTISRTVGSRQAGAKPNNLI